MSNNYNAKKALAALKASFVNNETSLDLAKFLVGYKELMKYSFEKNGLFFNVLFFLILDFSNI